MQHEQDEVKKQREIEEIFDKIRSSNIGQKGEELNIDLEKEFERL